MKTLIALVALLTAAPSAFANNIVPLFAEMAKCWNRTSKFVRGCNN